MHRAKLDKNKHLKKFAELLEIATIESIEEGNLTKDMAILVYNSWDVKEEEHWLRTEKFMENIDLKF